VGGGMLAALNGAIGQDMFRVMQTYNILMIVVMGGMGSISGSVLAAFIVTIGQEWLRVLDNPINLGPIHTEGIVGLRMVVFSILLLVIIIFFRNGLFGTKELTWSSLGDRLRAMTGHERKEAAS
jgi:branched-chain amino acid transport system permease protein